MKSIKIFLTGCLICVAALLAQGQGQYQSLYTNLADSKCRTLEVVAETGASVQSCPGIAGYKLHVLDDDSRQSITVIDPNGKEHPLNFWHTVTLSFSSLGNTAEWRVTKKNGKLIAHALIVRVNASEDAESPNRITSYLVVSKITAEATCVTHKIRSKTGANAEARRAANAAASAPCLKEITL
jgi:hypothetical protein